MKVYRPCKDCGYLPCHSCTGDWSQVEDRTQVFLACLSLMFSIFTLAGLCYMLHQAVNK